MKVVFGDAEKKFASNAVIAHFVAIVLSFLGDVVTQFFFDSLYLSDELIFLTIKGVLTNIPGFAVVASAAYMLRNRSRFDWIIPGFVAHLALNAVVFDLSAVQANPVGNLLSLATGYLLMLGVAGQVAENRNYAKRLVVKLRNR